MIITKEHQEALVRNYAKEKHNVDECIGFTDGLNAMLKLIKNNIDRMVTKCDLHNASDRWELLPELEIGDKIKLYGEETTVVGFEVYWNDALEPPKYEIILLTTGRGDPFYRSLDVIEVLGN